VTGLSWLNLNEFSKLGIKLANGGPASKSITIESGGAFGGGLGIDWEHGLGRVFLVKRNARLVGRGGKPQESFTVRQVNFPAEIKEIEKASKAGCVAFRRGPCSVLSQE
jgi:hypothetical protein